MASTTANNSFTVMEVDIDETPVAVHDCTMQDLSETQDRCHNISSFANPRVFLSQIEFRSDTSSSSESSVNLSISLQDAMRPELQDYFMIPRKIVDVSMLDEDAMCSREIQDPFVDRRET